MKRRSDEATKRRRERSCVHCFPLSLRRSVASSLAKNMPSENQPTWTRKHLLGLDELTADEIRFVLDTADSFKEVSTRSIKKVPALRGRVVVNAFFEDSTRTRTSFSLAAQRLSADVIDFSGKGIEREQGRDADRHRPEHRGDGNRRDRRPPQSRRRGAVLARTVKCSVVNAGDGAHEHPTQGLLDIYTMRERFGRIEGLKVAIVGDIANSRVARSNLLALTKLGAEVILVGPTTLLPGRSSNSVLASFTTSTR